MTTQVNISSWLDIRNHGFVRVAAVSPKVHLANPMESAKEHLSSFKKVYSGGAQLAVATECGLSGGYTIWDLVDSQTLQKNTLEAIEFLLKETRELNMLLVFGGYLDINSSRYNVAFVALKGKILAIVPKSYMASSGEFRDERWITPGLDIEKQEIDLLGQKGIPFGTDILVKAVDIENFTFHVQICQDEWVPVPPSTIASLNGATVLASINASPEIVGKESYQLLMASYLSASTYSGMVYCSSGEGESSTDLVFGGRMIISQTGEVLTKLDRFSEGNTKETLADIDLRALVHDRRNDPSFQSSMKKHKKDFRTVNFSGLLGINDSMIYNTFYNHNFAKLPFVPDNSEKREVVCQRIFAMQIAGVERRLLSLPEEARKLIVAVSGGADSALALMVAAGVMDKLGTSRSNIIALSMPGFGTTSTTFELSKGLIKSLGATYVETSIKDLASSALKLVDHDLETQDLTFENSQAWARKYVEWMSASRFKGMVLGTGDLSELILGWCTMYGDQASHYNPNAGLPKTLVWFMLENLANLYKSSEPEVSSFLTKIRNLKPSPELIRPSSKRELTQISENSVGPYELQDFNIYHLLRWGDSPSRIARKAYAAHKGEISLSEITKWLQVLMTRFLPNQFKRSTLPDGVLIGTIGVSPRDKFKIPSDAISTIWKEDISNIPLTKQ